MRSLFANLRVLVLPFNATSGRRIIVDGINGFIDFYNSVNALRMRLMSDTAQGQIRFYPSTGLGDGTVYALIDSRSYGGGSAAGVLIRGTVDGSGNSMSTYWAPNLWRSGYQGSDFSAQGGLYYADTDSLLFGEFVSDVLNSGGVCQIDGAWYGLWFDNTHMIAGVVAFKSGGNNIARLEAYDDTGTTVKARVGVSESGSVTVTGDDILFNGFGILSQFGDNIETSSTSSFTTTETVTDQITVPLVDGDIYEVWWTGGIQASVATDTLLFRIRADSVVGTQLAGGRVIPGTTASYGPVTLRARYTATATGNKTFCVTGVRNAGTGNFIRIGAADNQSIISVRRLG